MAVKSCNTELEERPSREKLNTIPRILLRWQNTLDALRYCQHAIERIYKRSLLRQLQTPLSSIVIDRTPIPNTSTYNRANQQAK